MDWINAILQGVLLGGLYALFAAGLSLIFGVMKLVNIAHGDLIVLAAYVALVVTQTLGIGPLPAILIVVVIMAAIGYVLQRGLLNFTLGDDILPPLLVTFGLSIIIQNALLMLFTADSRKLQAGQIEIDSIQVGGGLAVGTLPLIQFVVAVLLIAGLQLMLYRTRLGRSFRAVSDDQEVARLMGIDNRHIFGPAIGPARLIFGFEAVIMGGLASLWGTLAGGILLGVAQTIGAKIDPGWQILAGHLLFLAVLAVKPSGLFSK
jgi:branched-chain amino acid transport system permease protein